MKRDALEWNFLCKNARIPGLNMEEFSKLESFFQTLDPVFFSNCVEKVFSSFPHDEVKSRFVKGDLEKFYLLCIIANFQRMEELYRAHGWPEDSLREISGDLRCWEPVMLRDLGHPGLTPRLFSWAQSCLTGDVKQFGRLQCNDIHLFALKQSLYRQTDGSLKMLPAFEKGNPADPDLTYGDKTINLHIPASGALKASDCLESLRRMCEFSDKFHPDYDYKAIVCYSWLLDPQFREILPDSSNIVQFQKLGRNLPNSVCDQTREVIWRLWGVPGLSLPVEKLPCHSTLERGVVEFLKQGRHFGEGVLVIFKDELKFF